MHVVAEVIRNGLAWFGLLLLLGLVCEKYTFVRVTGPVSVIIAVIAALGIIFLEYMAD